MLLRVDDRILPVEPRCCSFDGIGFTIFDHLLEYSQLIRCQAVVCERLAPTLELRFVCHSDPFGRRGRCLAEMDLITKRRRRILKNCARERSSATLINACTAGLSSAAASSSTICRTLAPLPLSSFCGSGRPLPFRKNSVTHRGYNAIEKIASEARSVGPKPITSAL